MAQIDSKILGRGCRTVTNPGCWLFSPNLKVEKKKSQKNTSPGQSWESQVVGLRRILGSGIWMWGQSKKKKNNQQPSGVCSWGTLPFARDLLALPHPLFSLFPPFPPSPRLQPYGGEGKAGTGASPRDAGRAFPHPGCVLTEVSPRCRQPRAATAVQIYFPLPLALFASFALSS